MNQHQSSPYGLEPLLNIDELADYLGVPVSTIYDWRTNGKAPVPTTSASASCLISPTSAPGWTPCVSPPPLLALLPFP